MLRQVGQVICENEHIEMSVGNEFDPPYYFYYTISGYVMSLNTESGKSDTVLYLPDEKGGIVVSNRFSSGHVLVTSSSVIVFEEATHKVTHRLLLPGSQHGLSFVPLCIKADRRGNFWIGGRANLFIYSPSMNSIRPATTSFVDSVSNKEIIVNDIVNDSDGLFIATINNGLLKYDNRYTIFENFHLPVSINNSLYSTVVVGRQLLSAPNSGGILRFHLDSAADRYRLYPVSRKYGDITEIEKIDAGHLWVIFRDKFKLATVTVKDLRIEDSVFFIDSINESYFNAINNKFPRIDLQPIMRKVSDGLFYYSVKNRLYLVSGHRGAGFDFLLLDSVPASSYISAIGISPAKRIVVGTGDLELFTLEGTSLVKRYSPKEPMRLPAKNIVIDDAGLIYMLTINGLYIFDKDYRLTRHLTAPNISMLNNILYSGAIDKNGLLWMAANDGLIAYDTKSGRVYRFSASGLLHDRAFNSRSVYKDSSDNIYFGGSNGITEVHTDQISADGQGNKLYFENIRDLDSVLHSGIMPGSFQAKGAFQYNKNTLSFSVGMLSYQKLADVEYRYFLEGFDTGWSAPTESHTISYINLPPGRYKFRVDQADRGYMPGREIDYSFRIDKPFWETSWFILAVVFSSICLLAFVVRYFLDKRLEAQRIEVSKEIAVKTERERISQDLHDDLGSGLTSIRLLAKGVIAKRIVDEKTFVMLQSIAKISSELIDQMSEIVWLMNHMHDTMNGLLAHLRAYMADYLQRTDISLHLDITNYVLADHFISGQQRRSILLVVKEAFHNVVKHSHASKFSISCSSDKEFLKLVISDNGIGLPEMISPTGNGLNNIRKRINAINGTVVFESKAGTVINVVIPKVQKVQKKDNYWHS
jgi:signal transduction histidine kinase